MTGEFEINQSGFLPLREVVYETLRKAILKEKLKPGERLLENTIANKLGVSRTPVREAIRMLSDEGLVVMIPRRGAQVAQISRKDLHDVMEIRRSLEILAAELVCRRINEKQLLALEMAEQAFRRAAGTGVIVDIAEADIAFHDLIYKAAGNVRLLMILNNLHEQMYRFRIEYLKQPDVLPLLCSEHDAIVDAFRRRDAQKAGELIGNHIDNQQKAIDSTLSE